MENRLHYLRAIMLLLFGLALGIAATTTSGQFTYGANESVALSVASGETTASSAPQTLPSGSGMSGIAHGSMGGTDTSKGGSSDALEPLHLTSTSDRMEAFTNPLAAPPVLTGTNIM